MTLKFEGNKLKNTWSVQLLTTVLFCKIVKCSLFARVHVKSVEVYMGELSALVRLICTMC